MVRFLIGGILIVHGLIVAGQSTGAFGGGKAIVNPSWLKAIGGAGMSLLMLLFYLHPFYGIGIGVSAAILLALLWADWPALEQVDV